VNFFETSNKIKVLCDPIYIGIDNRISEEPEGKREKKSSHKAQRK